jgi:hypothetical protein
MLADFDVAEILRVGLSGLIFLLAHTFSGRGGG